ncbi:ABC transporter substrate-binding protein [Streptomyces hoynatensis]|uniref:Peptide-binding protein n=1 Tax=Streptomyces hoynatensis TaxID=1141874 RepID=A0A3A9ZHY3_9ACTN|nr:ABC transporter substrate-binding protein [Streptomyces hoynatensis]RKN46876.1 peptide-binding protein [Streptomyces hoynatensis]
MPRTQGRRAVRGAVAAGVAVLLVAGAVGGWMFFRPGGGEDRPIVVGTTSAPTTLDPGGAYDTGAFALLSNLYQSLMTFVPGQEEPVPDAAERCEFTDNQLTVYRCRLRDDLTFSNGDEVTAEDVKFSYDRILAMAERAAQEAADPGIPAEEKFSYAGPAGLLAGIEAVRTDRRDVIFELKHPDATFPFVVAGSAGAIVDRHSYEELTPRQDGVVVGSGPYVLSDYRPNEYAELEPNPHYHTESGIEAPKEPVTVRFFVQGEDGTSAEEQLAAAWHEGTLDVNAGTMPPDFMAGVNHSDPTFQLAESTGADIRVLAFNTDADSGVSERAVRRAAAALIDREAIAGHAQHDTVEPLYSLIPVGYPGHATPFYDRYHDTDVEELRAQLLQAGLSLPVHFTLAYSRGTAAEAEAAEIQRQLEDGGLFDVDVEYHEWSEFIQHVYGPRDYDAYLMGWTPDFPDPAAFTGNILGEGDGLATGFRDESVDRLIAATEAEPDRGRAAEDFQEIDDRAARSAPVIPLWQSKRIILGGRDITGIQTLSSGGGVLRLWELSRI